jgi:hypothetical protein
VIRFASVSLGSGGGVRCSRCHGPAGPARYRSVAEVTADVEAAAAGWIGAPGPNVTLSGPEPFGHPELPALISAAVRASVRRVRLDTGGSALRSPVNAAGGLSAGVRHIAVTLLGGTPGVHDALAGEPGGFDAAVGGARAFRAAAVEADIAVCISVIVPACRHNVHDLPAAVTSAFDATSDTVAIVLEDGGVDLVSALPWITSACDTGVVNGVWVEVEGVPLCLLPGHVLHVADVMRARAGARSLACAGCAPDAACGGLSAGASADLVGLLHPPADADRVWRGVARARGEAHLDG